MKEILPVILFLIATICNAEDWTYTGSSTEFIPLSRDLGDNWSRSLVRTVNEKNELKGLFQSTAPDEIGPTTNFEIFRRENKIREFSEVEFYLDDTAQGKQTYQLVILVFENRKGLEQYWKVVHEEHIGSPVFTTVTNETHSCIFRLNNIYVRVSSRSVLAECERIAGRVFKLVQVKENESNKSRAGKFETETLSK